MARPEPVVACQKHDPLQPQKLKEIVNHAVKGKDHGQHRAQDHP